MLYARAAYAGEDYDHMVIVLGDYSLSAYENEYSWRDPSYDYRIPDVENIAPAAGSPTSDVDDVQPLALSLNETSDDGDAGSDDEEFVDKILGKIPYSKTLKSTWKVIDGDVDLYVEGLRFDRGNKGVEYKTNKVPFVGEVEGMMFKAEAGEDSKVKFESSRIPFVGNVEGFKFKTSVGEESSISMSYKVSLDKLGL